MQNRNVLSEPPDTQSVSNGNCKICRRSWQWLKKQCHAWTVIYYTSAQRTDVTAYRNPQIPPVSAPEPGLALDSLWICAVSRHFLLISVRVGAAGLLCRSHQLIARAFSGHGPRLEQKLTRTELLNVGYTLVIGFKDILSPYTPSTCRSCRYLQGHMLAHALMPVLFCGEKNLYDVLFSHVWGIFQAMMHFTNLI